jgi:GTP-binding protein Era
MIRLRARPDPLMSKRTKPTQPAPDPAPAAEPCPPLDGAPGGAPGYRAGFVALVGRPNVGKSTLLNAMLGEKVAIVSPKPQTTRRRVLGIHSTDGAQAIFVDTPGLHQPSTALGTFMVREARAALPEADLVVWVVDASRPPADEDRRVAGLVRGGGRPVILVLNKSDLLAPDDVLGHTAAYADLVRGAEWLLTVARDGYNLDRLWGLIASRLPESPPLYPPDQLTDQTERAFAAELIREAALKHLQQEVPHGVEVVVEDWSEQPNGVLRLAAKLIVERAGHKAIVIGEGGQMLKRIGSSARRELERSLDRRVYLELFVSVKAGWRRDEAAVRRLGYR